jgi:hypothetical protein
MQRDLRQIGGYSRVAAKQSHVEALGICWQAAARCRRPRAALAAAAVLASRGLLVGGLLVALSCRMGEKPVLSAQRSWSWCPRSWR